MGPFEVEAYTDHVGRTFIAEPNVLELAQAIRTSDYTYYPEEA